MRNVWHALSLLVAFGFGVAVGVFAPRVFERPREVTVYPIITIGGSPPYPAAIAVYRIDVRKQDVMWWRPGNVESPARLSSCAVRDTRNWRCEEDFGGDRAVVEMQNGSLEKTVLATQFKER